MQDPENTLQVIREENSGPSGPLYVPLEYTVDLVMERIHENHEILTSITRNDMRKILLVCTKKLPFRFRDVVYLPRDGVAMGSPLGPLLAEIFMVDLERSLVPLLTAELSFLKRYVDDTITFAKIGRVDNILSMLNNFHPNHHGAEISVI